MVVVALTHTEGVILNNKYVVLELAYRDVLGMQKHFFIQSPICYTKAKQCNKYLKKSLEVIMCTSSQFNGDKVYKFYEVLQFLRDRYELLRYYFGYNIQFGYKGKSFQRDILVKCNIPCFNIEQWGVPSIKTLMNLYPFVKTSCGYHMHHYNKCAQHILRLINIYVSTSQS